MFLPGIDLVTILPSMVYTLNYRRPTHVSGTGSNRDSINGTVKQKSIDGSIESGNSGLSSGIPEALSFDRIIAGGVCPVSLTANISSDYS